MRKNDSFVTNYVYLAWIVKDNGEIRNGNRIFQEWEFRSYALIYFHKTGEIENILSGEIINRDDSDYLSENETLKIEDSKSMLIGDYDKVSISRDQLKEFVNKSNLEFRGYERPKTLIRD